MALKPCNECKTDISRRAKTCPHCGVKKPFQSKFERGVNDAANGLIALGCLLVVGVPLLVIVVSVIAGAL